RPASVDTVFDPADTPTTSVQKRLAPGQTGTVPHHHGVPSPFRSQEGAPWHVLLFHLICHRKTPYMMKQPYTLNRSTIACKSPAVSFKWVAMAVTCSMAADCCSEEAATCSEYPVVSWENFHTWSITVTSC